MEALHDVKIIRVSGEQRHEYMHGQLTIATTGFDKNQARVSAHCDFKGKMFSSMIVSDFQDSFLLSMHKDSALESEAQLKKYGVFSKVDITINQVLHPVGIAGEENIAYLKEIFPSLSEKNMAATSSDSGQVVCFNDASLRYLCYLSDTAKQQLLALSKREELASSTLWNTLEIEAGLANIQSATLGQFVPQMLNFQNLHAIDFDKGCYMGQEVVARTKFLGKNKRATFLLTGIIDKTVSSPAINAGDVLEMQIGESWRRAGVVVRSALSEMVDDKRKNSHSNGMQIKLLGVLPNDTAQNTVLRLKDSEVMLNITLLPYAVTQ
jgi:folate-binding protein YgfZ